MTDIADINVLPFLDRLANSRIAVFGDFCVDAYWSIDPSGQSLSLETGLPIRCVQSQRYSLGGAGNVVANLCDLGVRDIKAIGIVGADLFGPQLLRLLTSRRVDVTGMIDGGETWQTNVYAKPYTAGVEDSRLDFGVFNVLNDELSRHVLEALTRAARTTDVVILNQQFSGGVNSARLIAEVNRVIAAHPKTKFIVDSRHLAGAFQNAILKLNTREAARLLEIAVPEGQDVPTAQALQFARDLSNKTQRPVFVTRGRHGLVVADGESLHAVPGIQIIEQTDEVGAGDTVIATVAASLAAGATAYEAAVLANIAASITVRKLQVTGTATPAEIRAAGASPDYVYQADLADNPRLAEFVPGTEIEIIGRPPANLHIQHAIFDHDGTLSVLREGWEQIMLPTMVRAVLGPKYESADTALFAKVNKISAEFIDKTTGIQTLAQMQGLAKIVRHLGFVPEEQILDEHGYKKIYNDALLAMVSTRINKLTSGELDSLDFQVKNAGKLLQALYDRGVKLYLASGTDVADVIAEAKAMGYVHLFEGRIFGATTDVNVEAKRMVLERIMREHQLRGHQFVTFGDGPVEMRETRKRGGVCVGVASDEVRRFGGNPAKRSRLVRAGAGLIVPDFSQLPALLKILQLA
ncbi:hypothetical protein BH10PLA1_BH10PLA1_11310 [soil metagenome]